MKYLVIIKIKTPSNYDVESGVWEIETESADEAIKIAVDQEKRAYGDNYLYTIFTKAIEYKDGECPNFREEMDKANREFYKEFAGAEIAKELNHIGAQLSHIASNGPSDYISEDNSRSERLMRLTMAASIVTLILSVSGLLIRLLATTRVIISIRSFRRALAGASRQSVKTFSPRRVRT